MPHPASLTRVFHGNISSLHWVEFMLFVLVFLHWSMFRLYLFILPTSLFHYYKKSLMSTIIRTDIVATQFVFWVKILSPTYFLQYTVSNVPKALFIDPGKSRQNTWIPPTGDYNIIIAGFMLLKWICSIFAVWLLNFPANILGSILTTQILSFHLMFRPQTVLK